MHFSFLHAADLHLDSPLLGLRGRAGEDANPFVEATRRAFDALVALAIERRTAFLLLSGDLFDGDWRDFASGQFVVKQFARLGREGIKVYLIRGNHDAENVVTKSLPLPSNVVALRVDEAETVVLDEFEVAIHGRGFATRHVDENVVLSYPPPKAGLFNIGMLHTSLTGRDGHGAYAPCSLDDLKSRDYQYWALGHIHRREVVCDAPHVVYPGNVQGRHSKEDGPKGCIVVHVDEGKVSSLEFCPLDVVRFATLDVDLTGADTMDEAFAIFGPVARSAAASAQGRPVAARVRLTGRTSLHRRLTAERLDLEEGLQAVAWAVSDAMLVEKVVDRTSDDVSTRTTSVPNFDEALLEASRDGRLLSALSSTLSQLRATLPAECANLMSRGGSSADEYLRLAVDDALNVLAPALARGSQP